MVTNIEWRGIRRYENKTFFEERSSKWNILCQIWPIGKINLDTLAMLGTDGSG
jgi:hypothetical protein